MRNDNFKAAALDSSAQPLKNLSYTSPPNDLQALEISQSEILQELASNLNFENNYAARKRKGCKVIANCEHANEKHYAKVSNITR